MTQLDLLSWTPPRKMLVFPLARRVGRIRRVAEILQGKNGKAADSYWRQTVDAIVSQMDRAGIDRETIRAEVRAFHDAVQMELTRLAFVDQRAGRPGGDAA